LGRWCGFNSSNSVAVASLSLLHGVVNPGKNPNRWQSQQSNLEPKIQEEARNGRDWWHILFNAALPTSAGEVQGSTTPSPLRAPWRDPRAGRKFYCHSLYPRRAASSWPDWEAWFLPSVILKLLLSASCHLLSGSSGTKQPFIQARELKLTKPLLPVGRGSGDCFWCKTRWGRSMCRDLGQTLPEVWVLRFEDVWEER
jgi:hypothetical protein